MNKSTFLPGDLICLKKTYRGTGHPDDFIVGIVISSWSKRRLLLLFSERIGVPAIEFITLQEAETYYFRLSR